MKYHPGNDPKIIPSPKHLLKDELPFCQKVGNVSLPWKDLESIKNIQKNTTKITAASNNFQC